MKMITIALSVLCCLFVVGCGGSGRTPEPVLSYMPGDGAMSCEELHVEMAKMKQEVRLKSIKIKERENRNRELASLWFLIYPLAEIDTFKAEEVERDALVARYNNLFMIAVDKGCSLANNTIVVKKSGGRDVTVNDVLEDELPSRIEPLASLSQ